MSYTEQDVERATQIFVWHWRSSGPRGETFTEAVRNGMRAALEAIEREPLEDVLDRADVSSVDFALIYGQGEGGERIVTSVESNVWIYGDNATGTGATIDEAVRNAVASAKGDE